LLRFRADYMRDTHGARVRVPNTRDWSTRRCTEKEFPPPRADLGPATYRQLANAAPA